MLMCKGCNGLCNGHTRLKINNNLYTNYSEINFDKFNKSDKRIITNIFIPESRQDNSPENSNIYKAPSQKKMHPLKNKNKKARTINEKNIDDDIKKVETNNIQFKQILNQTTKPYKNKYSISQSLSISTTINNISNNNIDFNNYNFEMLNFLNKVRNEPKSIFEDIDNIKNNVKIIDNKEYAISDSTNEMIMLSSYFNEIKEYLNFQEPADSLKLNNRLEIKNNSENTELIDNLINELVTTKKKEIYYNYPDCFFYPIFIRDIKIGIILLLENQKLREKIFNNDFSHFYATTFNEKNNRFFSIICLA